MSKASSLMVSWQGSALVLATEVAEIPELNSLAVPARARKEEGILYLHLLASEKGGGRA